MKKQSYPISLIFALTIMVLCLMSQCTLAQQNSSPNEPATHHDGQHDFDFHIGTWKTQIHRLLHPLKGSKDWVDLTGTVHVRKVWNGRGLLEEIEADGSTGHFEGLTLFLYHPDSHQWAQYFADSEVGVVSRPQIGEFTNGRGELFSQEPFNGRTIFVRFVWSDITPDSHHIEQSFSDDGGKTWEPNFIATLTREKETAANEMPLSKGSTTIDGAHDFDFNFGKWTTHIKRLLKPLTGSNSWTDYDGTSVVTKIWGGRASLLELDVNGPAGHLEGVGLRLFNPKSRQWSLNWANGFDPVLTAPMVGRFVKGEGQFYDQEEFAGRIIMARNGFSSITQNSSRFEQAYSDDSGKTWEINWIMTFTR